MKNINEKMFIEKLKNILKQEDTILFLGSGISIWSGLPTWSGIIDELALFLEQNGKDASLVKSERRKGDLLQAASYGFHKLTKPQINEFMKIVCRYGKSSPHEIHRKIVNLGPKCFITTNYDDLLEQSLRKWSSDFYPSPVTNRHLTETAEIAQARSTNFIFKPHGDVADGESIILTREQYRQLLPQGEKQAALETLKVLLASRRIVYLGFGLRDPDFLYIKDLLINTYKGGGRDHYAIMSNVNEEEMNYWSSNYGIHLINYNTKINEDKSQDHSELLNLLDSLLRVEETIKVANLNFNPCGPDTKLDLIRHASTLSRCSKLEIEFPIKVNEDNGKKNSLRYTFNKFDSCPVDIFLDSGPAKAILIGLPGAGKTYSLKRSASRLAELVHENCLNETSSITSYVIPIFADLKLYKGNLEELVDQTLPKKLPFKELIKHFKFKVFLDSFNEMPREYLENNLYEKDFYSFFKVIDGGSVVIGSRTIDGLEKLDFPVYHLDQIDEKAVSSTLEKFNIELSGRFNKEVISLLQKPFYFQYLVTGQITLTNNAHPRDFYKSLFINANKKFEKKFNIKIDLEEILSVVAYSAIELGEEAFPLGELLKVLEEKIDFNSSEFKNSSSKEIANWLVSISIINPYSGNRIAFIHQSVTEYLAAKELSRLYLNSSKILKEKLKLTRWDQTLFLALSLLPEDKAVVFFQDVVEADFLLAFRSVKYLENNQEEIINKLLDEVPKFINEGYHLMYRVMYILESLPVTELHEPAIRKILETNSFEGNFAITCLVKIHGNKIKEELLNLLMERYDDFNLCSAIGVAMREFANENDIIRIVEWINQFDEEKLTSDEDHEKLHGIQYGLPILFANYDVGILANYFGIDKKTDNNYRLRMNLLSHVLQKHHNNSSLSIALSLLENDLLKSAYTLYAIIKYNDDAKFDWSLFRDEHVSLIKKISFEKSEAWGLMVLRIIFKNREDLRSNYMLASNGDFLEQALIESCIAEDKQEDIFLILEKIVDFSDDELTKINFNIIKSFNLDWSNREILFVKILKRKNLKLINAVFPGMVPLEIKGLGMLDLGNVIWYLAWLQELSRNTNKNGVWIVKQLGSLLGSCLTKEDQDKIINEFNDKNSIFRDVLMEHVLVYFHNFTTDDLVEDSTKFLIKSLATYTDNSWNGHILGLISTEKFVKTQLLPLIGNKEIESKVRKVIERAGMRHGCRYLLD